MAGLHLVPRGLPEARGPPSECDTHPDDDVVRISISPVVIANATGVASPLCLFHSGNEK